MAPRTGIVFTSRLRLFKSGFGVRDGLRMRFARDLELRLHLADAGFDLADGGAVIIEPIQHILAVELGDDIALFHAGARLDGILQDEPELARHRRLRHRLHRRHRIPSSERSGSGTQARWSKRNSCDELDGSKKLKLMEVLEPNRTCCEAVVGRLRQHGRSRNGTRPNRPRFADRSWR